MGVSAFYVLANLSAARQLLAAFEKSTRLTVRLVGADGQPALDKRRAHDPCFCAVLRMNPKGRMACERHHRQLLMRVQRTRTPQLTHCFAGLTEIAAPVFVNGTHVATLLAGRVLRGAPTRRDFDRLSRQLGCPPHAAQTHRLRAAHLRLPVIPQVVQQANFVLLKLLARQLSEIIGCELLATKAKEPPHVRRAKDFARDHACEPITASATAHHVGLCLPRFCQQFKKHTGMTFTEYLACCRVAQAKELLRDPQQKILTVALAAGFQSLPTFNRVFKKHTGLSPSGYRAALVTRHCDWAI